MKFVIIGSGPAGIIAAETIRKKLPEAAIQMLTKDPVPALSPVMLTYWAGGKFEKTDISFRPENWAQQFNVDLLRNTPVIGISPEDRKVLPENRPAISFDRLLVACGAKSISLPIPGSDLMGVGFFRNFYDTDTFIADPLKAERVVIIGGGFIGMKLACHLRERGFAVVILERENCLASRTIDDTASQIITAKLEKHGIQVKTGVFIKNIIGRNGRVLAVALEDGTQIETQQVVLAAGVRPNIEIVEKTDIRMNRGIVVNEHMQTSFREIYAAGDVAVTKDSITGEWLNNAIWPAATQQGNVAGSNMAGEAKQYRHNFPINALELFGMRIMSAGYPLETPGDDVTVDKNLEKGEYIKRVIRQKRLCGFIMIGKIDQAGRDLQMMKKQTMLGVDVQKRETASDSRRPKGFGYAHGRIFR